MPKKIFVSAILFLLIIPVYFQIVHVHAADEPVTPPITSDITPTDVPTATPTMSPTATPTVIATPTVTLTPTITMTPTPTPQAQGTLVGHITYRKLGIVPHNTPRATAAAGVTVQVNNFFGGGAVKTTTTDGNGNYGFTLPAGLYTVKATDSSHTFFVPSFTVVHITDNKQRKMDFQGLIFGSF